MSYTTIIAAIDTAIEAWVGEPVSISSGSRSYTYRSLADLIAARKHYAALLNGSGETRSTFKVAHFKPGGAA